MKIAGKRCASCGTVTPNREVADDEVCNCGSRICLVSSAPICITTNRSRTGTFRTSEYEAKRLEAPVKDRMVHAAPVRK